VRARQQVGGAAGRLRLRLPDHLQHLDRHQGGEGNLGALGAGHGRGSRTPAASHHLARRPALCPHRAAARPGAGLAHSRGRGDAGRGAVGSRLDDLRRARVPQHRRDARRRVRHRRGRPGAGETGVPADRAIHGRALGDGRMSTIAAMDRARSAYRSGLTLLLAAALYEVVARSGFFPAALLPTLPKVADTLWTLLLDGTMLEHAFYTLYRVL